MDYKKHVAGMLEIPGVDKEYIASSLEIPPTKEVGDFALPCFKLAKLLRKSPVAIATELAASFKGDEVIESCEAVNGYLNFRLNRASFVKDVVARALSEGEGYGGSDMGAGKTVCIDYSSINIAKPFHIGHLSTTVIGAALYRIFNFLGYRAVGINHLGDYGTQFGKLIYAYKHWSNKERVEEYGLKELTSLYVRYHELAEAHPEMDDEARGYFKAIETGDEECVALFEYFKSITLKETEKIYDLLGVTFDSYAGESFYNDKMQPVVDELKADGLLVESEGAMVVDLSDYGMPPCIILRSDGASLYATRDLAAAFYRKKTYDFDKCLYVVAYQQNLHFQQLFKVLELMGKPWAKDMVHVSYGMVSLEDGAMSTRHGRVVLLEDVIDKTIEKALEVIDAKNPELENKEETAKLVGTGAVIFGALAQSKIKDIVFSYEKALNFDGETGPYVQYTVARCNSILKRAGDIAATGNVDTVCDEEFALAVQIETFPSTVVAAAEKYEPSFIARYAVETAKAFNKFYLGCKVIGEDAERSAFRLKLVKAARHCLVSALGLLGIKAPEKM